MTLASLVWGLSLWGVRLPWVLTPTWHAHEMVFGFGGALVSGFLLTAVPNWTKTRPLQGLPLALLFVAWGGGRVASVVDKGPLQAVLHIVAIVGLFAWWMVLANAILRSDKRRNDGVLLIALVLASAHAANIAVYWELLPWMPTTLPRLAVLALAVLMAVIGGRITPLFTKSHCRREGIDVSIRERGLVDNAALVTFVLTVVAWAFAAPRVVVVGVGSLAVVVNLWRMRGWGWRATWRVPLVSVLHVGHLWLVVALALMVLQSAQPTVFSTSWALHAVSAGALGTYGLGMMSRVSLGHTGRPLVAPLAMTVAFVVVIIAGALRLAGQWMGTDAHRVVGASALTLALAFGVFVVRQSHMLIGPRPDGK